MAERQQCLAGGWQFNYNTQTTLQCADGNGDNGICGMSGMFEWNVIAFMECMECVECFDGN